MCCFISYSHPSSMWSPPLHGGVYPQAHVLKPLKLGSEWRPAASRSHTLNQPLFSRHLEQGGQLSHPLMFQLLPCCHIQQSQHFFLFSYKTLELNQKGKWKEKGHWTRSEKSWEVSKQLSILLPVVKKTRHGIPAQSSDSDSFFT